MRGPGNEVERAVLYSPDMFVYSVTPRVKGRWHAPSGQRPVIPRDRKLKFLSVYRLADLIVFNGFLLGRRGAGDEWGGMGWGGKGEWTIIKGIYL